MNQQNQTFIAQQANDWIVKLETGAMQEGDEERFVAWLTQDEEHGEAFAQAEQVWKLMHQVKAEDMTAGPKTDKTSAQTSTAMRYLMPLAATLLITLFSAVWWQDMYFAAFADHYTATGQRLEQTLADGTTITLNTDSAVDIKFDSNQRLVKLLAGEIYVDVAADAERSFVVQADNLTVTALGTEFIVNKDYDSGPKVTVTEHSVKVQSTSSANTQTVLHQGQQVTLIAARDVLSLVKEVNQTHAQAWLKGKYVFQDESLETVIGELNRYYAGQLIVRDNKLKSLKLSGVLDLDNPIDSLQRLSASIPIKIRKPAPYLVLIERG